MLKQIFLKHIPPQFVWSILIFVFCLLYSANVFPESKKTTIFFHSSETNINNFKSLKINFDGFLSKYGKYEFQPIKDRSAFEMCINEASNYVLVLSSWHYRILYKQYSLVPVLVGAHKGKKTQKRILVTRKSSLQNPLAGNKVASASNEHYTRTVMSGMAELSDLKILTVPKDIDALFAVGFGVCEFALTTEQAFNKLNEISPELYKTLKITDSCEESFLLIVAVPGSPATGANDLCRVIREMVDTPEGRKNLHMLGLDNWQQITAFDRGILEQKSGNNFRVTNEKH